MQDVSAFVLAGGASSRMGEDKAFIELQGRTLLARALELAQTVAGEVRIVGPAAKFSTFGEVVEDLYPRRGPLAGIHAALRASSAPLNLMLAVDTPFVEASFLRYLLSVARAGDATVTVPRVAGRWQPLCAVYRKEFVPVAETALQRGEGRIDTLFSRVPIREIGDDELMKFAFSADMFQNLNTREDLSRASPRA